MSRGLIPGTNAPERDSVMTPPTLARAIVKYLQPSNIVLEPCAGDGAFVEALSHKRRRDMDDRGNVGLCGVRTVDWFENDPARKYFTDGAAGDFLDGSRSGRYTWIVTNPPWSKLTPFLRRSFEVADNVAFLMPLPGAFFNARLNAARSAGFGIRRVLEVPWPSVWTRENGIVKPGFAIGAVHWERGYRGPLAYDVLSEAQVLGGGSDAHQG